VIELKLKFGDTDSIDNGQNKATVWITFCPSTMYLYSIVSTVPYYLFLLFLLVCYVFLYFVFCQSAQVANKHLKNKICFVLNVACSCGAGVSGPARFEAWLDSLSR